MSKIIEYSAPGFIARITVRPANVGQDMRRNLLASRAYSNPLPDIANQAVAAVMFPRCMGALESGEINGKDAMILTVDEFIALPASFGNQWFDAAVEENPLWSLQPPQAESDPDTASKKE